MSVFTSCGKYLNTCQMYPFLSLKPYKKMHPYFNPRSSVMTESFKAEQK